MSVKARWGQAPVNTPTPEDPFADMGASERTPAEVGLKVTFGNSSRTYLERLTQLIAEMDTINASGVTCEIMDKPGTSCNVCPLSRHYDTSDSMQPLCSAGRDFERLSTEMAAAEMSERDARRG